MVFKVEHNAYIIGMLRRKWRKDGRYTVRVTHSGTISVIRMPSHKDMKTEAQMKCRMRFVKAQEMMLEALADKKLRRFFQKRRLRKGYKTLRGCMRAYYIDQLIFQEQKEAREVLGVSMAKCLSGVMTNAECQSLPDVQSVTTGHDDSAVDVSGSALPVVTQSVADMPNADCDIDDG